MLRYASLVSLGCAKNLVDSEMMIPQLEALGYTIASDPASASLILVNTCGFLESAVEEAIQSILELASLKESGACECLIATGCMVQRYGKKLMTLLPEVDLFLGASHCHRLREALDTWHKEGEQRLWLAPPRYLFDADAPRRVSTGSASAYIKIAEGCSNRCSFCLIPHLRGPFRSRTTADVVREAERLAACGIKEINLIAQDSTAFGSDRGAPHALIDLLERLDGVSGLAWIRLLYAYPERVSPELLHTMAQAKRIVPYLDIPIQHASARLLSSMRRNSTPEELEALIERIRSILPNVTLRTSLIVGFPGESEADFAELVRFVERVAFDHAGVFAFSPEPGTRAAKLPGQIDAATKAERRDRLMALQQSISRGRLGRKVGQILPVLIEGQHPETELLLAGRLSSQAPEVDGMVLITSGTASVGDIVPATITAAHDYDLEAQLTAQSVDGTQAPVRRSRLKTTDTDPKRFDMDPIIRY